MGQINTNNYPTVESLADADLLIVENSTNGTGTTTPKQLREHAIGTDPLQTTSQTVTGAINELKREIDEGGGSAVIGNPSDTASSILDKIKIGSRTYDASAIKPYTATNITTSAISISIGLAEDRALNGRIIAVNTGSLSGTPSNAWGLNILYNDGGSSVGCAILKSDGTAFTDAVTANEVLFLRMDMTNLEATIVNIAGASGGGGDLYAGLGVGKMVSFTNNVMDTDIDLHRAPMAGDRLLIWFDATVQNPTGLTTYNNGTAVTSNLENVIPLYYNAGWNLVEYMNDGLLYNNVWVRKQNVPIPNNTLFGLSDTAISMNPTEGQVLTFNSETGKWENKNPSGGGDTPTIPVLNKESVYSQNDVSSISKTFTAAQTAAYMVILSICNANSLPTITSASVTVNNEAQEIKDYYVTSGYGVNSKYALLNLEAGDTVSASLISSVESYGTSASIALVRLSHGIKGLRLITSDYDSYTEDPAIDVNVDDDGLYLLFFFDRHAGVGTFQTLKQNDVTITQNKIVCSSGSGWQVSHGMCIVSAKAMDNFKASMVVNGYFTAVGIMSLSASDGSGGVAESVVGTVENSTTASKAYAIGEHFIRNDKFCTAIAAIASGATFTLNTNYVEGTIADNLKAQNITSEFTFENTVSWNSDWNNIKKCGNVIQGTLRFTTPSSVTDDMPIIDIPAKYRPSSQDRVMLGIMVQAWSGTPKGNIIFGANFDTIIIASNVWPTDTDVLIQFSYML